LNGSSGIGDGEVRDEDDASMDDGAVARPATSAEDELGHLFLTQDLSQPTPASGAESAAIGTPAAGLMGDEDEAGDGSGDGDDEVEAFPASALRRRRVPSRFPRRSRLGRRSAEASSRWRRPSQACPPRPPSPRPKFDPRYGRFMDK